MPDHPLVNLLRDIEPFRGPLDPDALFRAALTRRGHNQEAGTPDAPDHEPLEWLGDRILGAVVAAELWRRFPHAAPGRLDLARDALTSAEVLAEVGRELRLLDIISMTVGEREQRQVEGDKPLSDHVEALVVAAFLTHGWPYAQAFVARLLDGRFPDALPEETARADGETGSQAMTALNAIVQRRFKCSIPKADWDVRRVGGEDNAPVHAATVRLPDGTEHDSGAILGSKKKAKAAAAEAALLHLRG
jgi:ribonuclease-3